MSMQPPQQGEAPIEWDGGVQPATDQAGTMPRVSTYVKATTAGDTALALGQAAKAASLPVVMPSDQMLQASADGAVAADVLLAASGKFNGVTIDRERLITIFVQLQAVALTHGSPVSVHAPASGKKFRILSYHLSATVASAIQFEDGSGTEVLRTPLLVAATPAGSPPMGNGILSSAANNALFLDCTVTTNVSGWIGINEE